MALVTAVVARVAAKSVTAGTAQAPSVAAGMVVVVVDVPPPPPLPPQPAKTNAATIAAPKSLFAVDHTDEHPHDDHDDGANEIVPKERDPRETECRPATEAIPAISPRTRRSPWRAGSRPQG